MGGGPGDCKVSDKRWVQRLAMHLYLVRGNFFTAAAASAAADPVIMDAEVWSKLPEQIMCEVLRFVPVAKLFQWQLVSRKWRHELTSAHFRKRLFIESEQQQQQGGVIACVWVTPACVNVGCSESTGSSSSSDIKVVKDVTVVKKVVSLSMVPSSFWSQHWGWHSLSVVAAGHGLLCISNENELSRKRMHMGRETEYSGELNSYCVLNPLTRACVVLPASPFQPDSWVLPTSTCVAIFGASSTAWRWATYDLAAADGTGSRSWVCAHKPLPRGLESMLGDEPPSGGALLGGQTFWYTRQDRKVHVLAADEVEEVGALDAPSVTLLGLDQASVWISDNINQRSVSRCFTHIINKRSVVMMEHRGVVYFVAQLRRESWRSTHHAVCGVWRLARKAERMEWEGVALLNFPELERRTGASCLPVPHSDVKLHDAYGVRELVCCQLHLRRYYWDEEDTMCLVGLNLDTSKWEPVYCEQQGSGVPSEQQQATWAPSPQSFRSLRLFRAFELRPDVFLSS